jgi:hypothetical protein
LCKERGIHRLDKGLRLIMEIFLQVSFRIIWRCIHALMYNHRSHILLIEEDIALSENRLVSLNPDHFTIWSPYDYYIYQVVRPAEYAAQVSTPSYWRYIEDCIRDCTAIWLRLSSF